MSFCWLLREEFRWKRFTLRHNDANDFAFSRWQRNDRVSGWFIIYRSLLVAFSLCIVLSSFFIYGWNYWFIYLTDLGILGQLAHLTISAASSVSRLFIERNEAIDDIRASGREGEAEMTALDRTSWVFYNMATNSSIVITVIYWTAIYDPVNGIDTMDFMVHAVNTIISLVDLVVSARPWRLLHFYQAILALALYVIFSIIYWAAGGVNMNGYPYIYSILDWNDPIPTVITLAIAAAAMIALHAILWALHLLRDYVSNLVSAKMLPRHSASPSVAYDNPIFTKVSE